MAHHHPQLHVHSQLANLGQGQVHYIQIPSSILPVAVPYEAQCSVKAEQTQILQRTAKTKGTGGRCVICAGSLPPRIARSGNKPLELFTKACQLLRVPVSEFENEWDFGSGEKLPFCLTCLESLRKLITLNEQLETIQAKLADGVEHIRNQIKDSVKNVSLSDLRTAKFRSKALGEGTSCSSASGAFVSNKAASNLDPGTTVPEFGYIFNTSQPISQSPIGLIQHDGSSRQNAQLTTYSTILSVGTPNQTNFPSSPHSTFTVEAERNNALSEDYSSTAVHAFYEDEGDEDDYSTNIDVHNDESSQVSNVIDQNACLKPVAQPTNSATKKSLRSAGNTSSKFRAKNSTSNDSRHNRSRNGRQNTEYFSPVQVDNEGRMIFEGIAITTGNSGYICGMCGAECGKGHNTLAMRKVKIHIKGFHLSAYKCSACNKNFTSNDILSQHIIGAHEVGNVPCDICGRPVKPKYMHHHKFTHMNAEEKEKYIAAGFKPQSSTDLERKFQCNTCGKTFKKRSILARHEASHKDVASRKDYKCQICDKGYTTDQALKDHIAVHHDPRNMRKAMCKECGKVMFPKFLKKHMQTHIAKEERVFICKICGRRLVNLRTLNIHEAAHDPSDKPETYKFECDICGQRFISLKRMTSHRSKIHVNHWKLAVPSWLRDDVTVSKPGEDFIEDLNNEDLQEISGDLFSYHLYEVQKMAEPGGYRCVTCSKQILGNENAEEEIKVHIRSEHIGNFRCNICTKRMKNINEVLAHKRREHMNKLDLSCNICGRPGLAAATIKKHEWSHKSPADVTDAINDGNVVPHSFGKSVNRYLKIQQEYGVKFEFICKLCQVNCDTFESLSQHRKSEHQDAPTVRSKRRLVRNPRKPRKRKYPEGFLDCPHCGKSFKNRYKLERHASVHRKKRKSSSIYRKKIVEESDINVEFNEQEAYVKEEVMSSCESSDVTTDEEVYSDGNQSDPEFKAKKKGRVPPPTGVQLRNRSSLRPRKSTNFSFDFPENDMQDDPRVEVRRLPIPLKSGTFKIKSEHVLEYITSDGERNEVMLSQNIKRSPPPSDTEEWDVNEEFNIAAQ